MRYKYFCPQQSFVLSCALNGGGGHLAVIMVMIFFEIFTGKFFACL